jgi:hypothetical protein
MPGDRPVTRPVIAACLSAIAVPSALAAVRPQCGYRVSMKSAATVGCGLRAGSLI